jgi:cell division septum initiation protein DivIVA
MTDDLIVAISRLEQENARLRAENAGLRKEVLEQGHRNAILSSRCRTCEYHPHPMSREHG